MCENEIYYVECKHNLKLVKKLSNLYFFKHFVLHLSWNIFLTTGNVAGLVPKQQKKLKSLSVSLFTQFFRPDLSQLIVMCRGYEIISI